MQNALIQAIMAALQQQGMQQPQQAQQQTPGVSPGFAQAGSLDSVQSHLAGLRQANPTLFRDPFGGDEGSSPPPATNQPVGQPQPVSSQNALSGLFSGRGGVDPRQTMNARLQRF